MKRMLYSIGSVVLAFGVAASMQNDIAAEPGRPDDGSERVQLAEANERLASAEKAAHEGRWREAMEAYAKVADLIDGRRNPSLRGSAGNMWVGAANAGAMANDWNHAQAYAQRAIDQLTGLGLENSRGPLLAFARTILAESALNAGDYERAWATAKTASGELESWEHNHHTDFDLRARYLGGTRPAANPREVQMLAGAMRFSALSPPERIEVFESLIHGSARSRNSSLADAILLARQRESAPAAKRALIDRLLNANTEVDRARRALAANDPDGGDKLTRARSLVDVAAAPAKAAGVVLRAPNVSLATLRRALEAGEGFLYLYESPYGILIWGIDAKGVAFVNVHELSLLPPNAGEAQKFANSLVRPLDRAIYYEMHRDFGRGITSMSAELAKNDQFTVASPYVDDPERTSGAVAMGTILRGEAIKLADPLLELSHRARWWTVSFSDSLDGIPLAMLRFNKESYFGTEFAYTIAPSIDAYLYGREAERVAPNEEFVGVGDIPFRAKPCDEWASAKGIFPALYSSQRNWILDQRCLAGARAQLSDLGRLGRSPVFLDGTVATEAGLRRFQGHHVKVLAFITHAVAADARSGGWPALLLYPPAKLVGSDDGRLLPVEAANLNIVADLVVLSACSTGAADEALGEEPLSGIARGFLLGGARSAIVTRWQIKFAVAGAMNRALATSLNTGKSRAEAMLDARLAGEAVPGSHPWDWGAFELIGEGGILH